MRKGKKNKEKKPDNLRLVIVISAGRGRMKDDRFFFPIYLKEAISKKRSLKELLQVLLVP